MPLRKSGTTWWGTVLDAPDAVALGKFYAELLGWRLFADSDSETFVTVAPSETAGYNLGFQTEPRYVRPVWPAVDGEPQMSMHLDIQVDELDPAVEYAVGCGATLADFQPQETVRVLLDPAGHPFCLYTD